MQLLFKPFPGPTGKVNHSVSNVSNGQLYKRIVLSSLHPDLIKVVSSMWFDFKVVWRKVSSNKEGFLGLHPTVLDPHEASTV